MQINDVVIEDTFAEAFPMDVSRLVITADSPRLALQAAQAATGLAISIIGCGCEAGLDEVLPASRTPDGRPGCAVLLFSHSAEKLEEQLFLRIGQAVMPSATSACFNGLQAERTVSVGGRLRYFGDGYQSSKLLDGRRYWRIPVADGEFVMEESYGLGEGVGGGNLVLLGRDKAALLEAAEAVAAAINSLPGVIAPFPGGVCRSPSKPGSHYRKVVASTNEAFCPTLRSRTASRLTSQDRAAYELVIDGLDEERVGRAMAAGLRAACRPGVVRITAGNYGGQLGPYHFHLHRLLEAYPG
jgi:formylmethanofuran--tetrahydromethanopterin N-formyltransferase